MISMDQVSKAREELTASTVADAPALATPQAESDSASLQLTDAIIDTPKDDLDGADATESAAQAEAERAAQPQLAQFMEACQRGELATIERLLSTHQVSATDTFADTVTGLHWAAINNHVAVCRYLCENDFSRATANARGGDLDATALHWACRSGFTYVVDYLLCHTDADALLRDSQSYNALHLAVHSSNIMLVVYMVVKCCTGPDPQLYIDEPDGSNRTCLHWAAYQGDIFSVNTLLRFGADVAKVDDALFIPLHWAFMRGSRPVLKALVEAKLDLFIKNDRGKDSFDIARDMNCHDTWISVLRECGLHRKNGWVYRAPLLDERTAKMVTFFLPYAVLPLVWHVCSFSAGYAIPKLFAAVVVVAALMWVLVSWVLPLYIRDARAVPKSPLLAGVFLGAAFWCVLLWLYNIVPQLWLKLFFTNASLACAIGVFGRTFFKTMFLNPGYVPTPSDNLRVYAQIKQLIALQNYTANTFSIDAYVRKPLRSKYSRILQRLVARFDHYCPWVYNEIGVRNHKLFVVFVYALNVSIVLWVYLSIRFFHQVGKDSGYDSDDELQQCALLSETLCIGFRHNPFHFNVLVFCLLQLVWVVILELTQTFQILKGITTWEFSQLMEAGHSSGPVHVHRNEAFSTCIKLVGLDQFYLTVKVFVKSLFVAVETHSQYNPLDEFEVATDYGWRVNWLDFWFLGEYEWRNLFFLPIEGENNLNGQVVDYYKLYEFPAKTAAAVV